MSFRFAPPVAPVARGAAPVGHLGELPGVERCAIVCLRGWCQGGDDRMRIAADLGAACDDFAALMTCALSGARRPLMRHACACGCFGGDESAFANMIAAAAGGDNEDAMLFACTLLRPEAAFGVVHMACRLAPVFLRLARDRSNGGMDALSPFSTKH